MERPDLDVSLDIAATPEEVRAWWLDFPPDYRARDPREEPHRIRTIWRTPEAVELDSFWCGPFGREVRARELVELKGDRAWWAHVRMMGFRRRDEFDATPAEDGRTRLRIRSAIEPHAFHAKLGGALLRRAMERSLRESWASAARLCEEDARATREA